MAILLFFERLQAIRAAAGIDEATPQGSRSLAR